MQSRKGTTFSRIENLWPRDGSCSLRFPEFLKFHFSICLQIVDKLRLIRYDKESRTHSQEGATMTAVIYARYSSDSQREASIEGQLRDCKDYAEKTVSPWSAPTSTEPTLPKRMTARTSRG